MTDARLNPTEVAYAQAGDASEVKVNDVLNSCEAVAPAMQTVLTADNALAITAQLFADAALALSLNPAEPEGESDAIDSGKSTLLRAIANGQVEGFPNHFSFKAKKIIGNIGICDMSKIYLYIYTVMVTRRT